MNSKKIIACFAVILFLFSVMAFVSTAQMTPSISLSQMTKADDKLNIFYLPENTDLQIFFNINSDAFDMQSSANEFIVKYSLKTYPEINSQDVKLSLSEDQQIFLSDVNTQISLNISANGFHDKTLQAEITAKLFDEYGNLLSTSSKSIILIANNSVIDFTYTKNRMAPRFRGIKYSRTVAYLNDYNDSDILSVKLVSDYDYLYGLECKPSDKAILADARYNNETKYFDIVISIDQNSSSKIQPGIYFLDCQAYNKDKIYGLKQIKINFVGRADASKESKTATITEQTTSDKSSPSVTSNISGFVGLKSSSLLIILGVLIVLAIIFA